VKVENGARFRCLKTANQRGFTLIEVMVSTLVLTVGLVSLLAVFALALSATQGSQEDLIAKQLASEAMESIVTARDTTQMVWNQIQNVGAGTTPDGIFVVGMQPIYNAGTDGIVGTADDANAGNAVLTLPGPDGIVGTSDDVVLPLTNYKRQIQITSVNDSNGNLIPSLRMVTITIPYTTTQLRVQKTYVLTSYISEYH